MDTPLSTSRLWLVASISAILLHLVLGYAVLKQASIEQSGQGLEGVGIELTLSTIGRPVPVTAPSEAVEKMAEQEPVVPKPQQTPSEPVVKPVAEPVVETVAESPPKQPVKEITQTPPIKTATPVLQQPAEPEAVEERQTAQIESETSPTAPQEHATVQEPTAVQEQTVAADSATMTSVEQVAVPTGTADTNATGGNPGVQQEAVYLAQVKAWLAQHKTYPRVAAMRRQEGVVMMQITIDRSGNIIDFRVQEKSGYRLLDKEARKIMERANPVPPIPDTIPEEVLELLIPVEFFLV